MFMPGDDDPLAGRPADPASAAPEVFGGQSQYGALQPYGVAQPTASAPWGQAMSAERPSVYEQVQGRGVYGEFDRYGQYGLALGIVGIAASVLLYVGYGMWWINVGLGIGAMYFGVRGRRAARRNLATNPGVALTGAILGGLSVLASVGYLVLIVVIVAILMNGAAERLAALV